MSCYALSMSCYGIAFDKIILRSSHFSTEDDDTKQMAKVDGGYMFISSLFSALLAFGVDPVKAMGYVAIGCFPLFVSFIGLVEDDAVVLGLNPEQWTFVAALFVGASAFAMLT